MSRPFRAYCGSRALAHRVRRGISRANTWSSALWSPFLARASSSMVVFAASETERPALSGFVASTGPIVSAGQASVFGRGSGAQLGPTGVRFLPVRCCADQTDVSVGSRDTSARWRRDLTTTIRLIGGFFMALSLAFVLPSDDVFAKKPDKPGNGGGGGGQQDAFCAAVSAPADFGIGPVGGFRGPNETFPAVPDHGMFGRPIAGRQMHASGNEVRLDVDGTLAVGKPNDILLAVGARPGTLLIYLLDPGTGQSRGNPLLIPLSANARNLAIADFNGDGIPDFVVAGFGPVEVFVSSLQQIASEPPSFQLSYDPPAHTSPDITGKVSVAATDSNVAIGVPWGDGKRGSPGKVFVYEYQTETEEVFSLPVELTGTVNGDRFGASVAFGHVWGGCRS